jgi:hypothetical protein
LLSSAQRVLRAKLAAHTLWATADRQQQTAAARRAFLDRFFEATDASLPLAERQRRAQHLKRAHFAKMAYERERARSGAKKNRVEGATSAAAGLEVRRGTDVERSAPV